MHGVGKTREIGGGEIPLCPGKLQATAPIPTKDFSSWETLLQVITEENQMNAGAWPLQTRRYKPVSLLQWPATLVCLGLKSLYFEPRNLSSSKIFSLTYQLSLY